MSETPGTDAIIEYCAYQFPATEGHIPLRRMIEEIELEGMEQARLNGMGGEREAALLGKVERLERDNARLRAAATEFRRHVLYPGENSVMELIAATSRLREALGEEQS